MTISNLLVMKTEKFKMHTSDESRVFLYYPVARHNQNMIIIFEKNVIATTSINHLQHHFFSLYLCVLSEKLPGSKLCGNSCKVFL